MTFGTIYILSFLTALSGALMPGPLLTVTIAQTARRGFPAAMLLICGHCLIELVLVIGLWFGLGHILGIKPVIGAITVLGGGMLIWMGLGMILEARRGLIINSTAQDGGAPETSPLLRNPVISGIIASVSNPYFTIWWTTIGLTFFAALSYKSIASAGAFYLGHITGDILWYAIIGAAVASGRKIITPKIHSFIAQVCGLFLMALGCAFLYLLISGNLWNISMTLDWLK